MSKVNKQVEINGEKYTLQKLPVKAAFDLREQWLDSRGGVDQPKMYNLVLEHLIVQPKKKLEEFDEIWELDEVVNEAVEFQYGKGK